MKDFIKSYIKKYYRYPYYWFPQSSFSSIMAIRTIDFLRKIKYYYSSLKNKNYLYLTKKYKDKFKDKNAFVFANGPSLKKIDFHKIKKLQETGNFKVICVNSYITSGNEEIVLPDIYVLSDPAFFGYTQNITKEREKEIKKAIEKLNRLNILCFIPVEFRKRNILKNVLYFEDFEYRWSKNVMDITKPRSYLSMTAYKALAISIYLGFQKIYICGFDNDWFKSIEVNEQNEIYYLNNHFVNQADSGLKKVDRYEANNLGELLYAHSFLFLDFYKFPRDRIINLDKSGLIDAFTKEHNLDVYKE